MRIVKKTKRAAQAKKAALADVYAYGYDVFGGRDRFNCWMKNSNRALGGKAPITLLYTLSGMEELKHLIGRIEHGVYG